MVLGNIGDYESLISAFTGATAIFGVTDFWGIYNDPASAGELKQGQTISEYACKVEVRYGKNIVDAAATVKGLEKFIWSTLPPTKKLSKGKYTWIYHFDGKAAVNDYLLEAHKNLAKKTSFITVTLYASNQLNYPIVSPRKVSPLQFNHHLTTLTPAQEKDGTYLLSFPGNGETPLPIIDTPADTGPFVKALIELPPGKNLLAYGSVISWNDWMKLWCQINGVEGSYKSMSLDDCDKMLLGGFGREVGESFLFMCDFGYDGGDPTIVYPKDVSFPAYKKTGKQSLTLIVGLESQWLRQVSRSGSGRQTGLAYFETVAL